MTKHVSQIRLVIALIGATASGAPALSAQSNKPPTALRIVVVEGEDAVNIVQQKTAVAPVVEVRDRDDQPVAGVIVQQ